MDLKRVLIITTILLLIIPCLAAQEISLNEFVRVNNFTYQWSPFLDTGELRRGTDSFRFKVGEDFIVHNFREKIPGGLSRRSGSLMLDQRTADAILQKTRHSSSNVPSSNAALSRINRNTQPSGYRVAAILIDPGHGGRDPGAIGRHTVNGRPFVIKEKDVTLNIALELDRKLRRTFQDKKIILTRNDDSFINLDDRVEKGNSVQLGDNEIIIMVSIHANASVANRNARGFEVWHLPPDFRRDLIDENSVDYNARDILHILNKMLEEEFLIESIRLAQNILDGLDASIGRISPSRGLKEKSWFVVRNAKMPAVLVEVGFVTNKEEAQLLASRAHLMKITEGIYNGIKKFINDIETIDFGGER
ncbi:MAG: N-acetylmuramoyl-L-alanine amidase [Spirochaetes bacterium]|nr:N-acetylmuramoyl-L-alanine amidase [Spirochaetota bacterium]